MKEKVFKTKKGKYPLPQIDIDDGITYFTFKGKREIKHISQEKRIAQNVNGIVEGDFKLNFSINSDEIFLNTAILINQTYDRGVLTFYYAFHDLTNDKGEDLELPINK